MTSSVILVMGLGALFMAGVVWAARRWPVGTLTSYLLLLLVHEVVVRILTYGLELGPMIVTAISLWKDVALLGLAAAAVIGLMRKESTFVWRRLDWVLGVLVLIGLISTVISPNRLAGVAALRDYFEVITVFYLARILAPTPAQLRRIMGAWLVVGVAMAALGIWQALGWTASDYRAFGFAGRNLSQSGIPGSGGRGLLGPRTPSTVTGPNEFGMHMVLTGLLAIQWGLGSFGRRRWALAGIAVLLAVALILSGSRSDLAGYVLALAVVAWHDFGLMRHRVHTQGRRGKLLLAGLVAAAAVVLGGGLVLSGMGSFVVDTFKGLANEYHVRDSLSAIAYLVQHPDGVGMGLVGPRQGFGFPTQAAFHVEGSLFQIAFEMGVWGLVVYLTFIGLVLRKVWKHWSKAEVGPAAWLSGTAVAGWVAALAVFLFLPLMQAMPLMAWLWFILGLGLKADQLEAGSSGADLHVKRTGSRAQQRL